MRKIVRERILKKSNFKCVNCGNTTNLQVDHIIPLCCGGKENEDNMQILCRSCNQRKPKRFPDIDKHFITNVSKDYILVSIEFLECMLDTTNKLKANTMRAILIQKLRGY